jgi:hypothetical protein
MRTIRSTATARVARDLVGRCDRRRNASPMICWRRTPITRTPPRFMLRCGERVRGHLRHLRSGRVSWVRPHKRGNGPTKAPRVGYELVPPSTLDLHP